MKKNFWVQAIVIVVAAIIMFCIIMYKRYYKELEQVRGMAITEVSLAAVKDGVYRGAYAYGGFTYMVDVTVAGGRYVSITVVTNRATEYSRKAEAVLLEVVSKQSLTNVDAHTGATTTTKAFLKAIENSFTNRIK